MYHSDSLSKQGFQSFAYLLIPDKNIRLGNLNLAKVKSFIHVYELFNILMLHSGHRNIGNVIQRIYRGLIPISNYKKHSWNLAHWELILFLFNIDCNEALKQFANISLFIYYTKQCYTLIMDFPIISCAKTYSIMKKDPIDFDLHIT